MDQGGDAGATLGGAIIQRSLSRPATRGRAALQIADAVFCHQRLENWKWLEMALLLGVKPGAP